MLLPTPSKTNSGFVEKCVLTPIKSQSAHRDQLSEGRAEHATVGMLASALGQPRPVARIRAFATGQHRWPMIWAATKCLSTSSVLTFPFNVLTNNGLHLQ